MSTPSLGHDPSGEAAEPLVETVPRSADLHHVLIESQAFAKARTGAAVWQVASTVGLLFAALAAARFAAWTPAHPLLLLVLAGLLMRTFVLQHDCGHLSLFGTKRLNDACGTWLAFLTGIPFHAWRTEHNWHHAHQGKLSRRGVDSNNSPPTVEEAVANPKSSLARAKFISPLSIFGMGPLSLMVFRKRVKGFFFFKPAYVWPVPGLPALVKSVRLTNAGHALFHLALLAYLGPWVWLALVLPAMLVACGIGGLLFWVQHNFEHTYFAPDGGWDFVRAGLYGSSYLKLPAVLAWFTAHIGVHHVHHINVRIPNYRLEEARRGVPAIAAIAPLSLHDLKRCFDCLFWDGDAGRLITHEALPREAAAPAPAEATAA
jgi:omega-6 fatty acid desaturase (delta-12 desaturase)